MQVGKLFGFVRNALEDRPAAPGLDVLLDSLIAGRFHFEEEQWHNVADCLRGRALGGQPRELLLRATNEQGVLIPHEALIRAVSEEGLQSTFDHAIALGAMQQAIRKNSFPVSINISGHAAADPTFWIDLHDSLQHFFKGQYDPQQVIWELTEDAQPDNIAIGALKHMRNVHGYSFAIDDLSHKDLSRLSSLGDKVKYVKIDGKSIEAAARGEFSLEGLVRTISEHAPGAAILAEWVPDAPTARTLCEKYNISLVSGHHLDPSPSYFGYQVRTAHCRTPAPVPEIC